ncbi:MAG: hypothetical protein AB1486_01875 [Planctomycetota bacterium]
MRQTSRPCCWLPCWFPCWFLGALVALVGAPALTPSPLTGGPAPQDAALQAANPQGVKASLASEQDGGPSIAPVPSLLRDRSEASRALLPAPLKTLSPGVRLEYTDRGEAILSLAPEALRRSWVATLEGESFVLSSKARLVVPLGETGARRVEGSRWYYRIGNGSRAEFSGKSGGLHATTASPNR